MFCQAVSAPVVVAVEKSIRAAHNGFSYKLRLYEHKICNDSYHTEHIWTFADGGGYSSLRSKSTAFMSHRGAYLRP